MQTFARRSKFVKKGKEAKFWKDITIDMMSDEEKQDNVYVRHPPSYHSDTLNTYIEKLDERSASVTGSHAKFERKIGSPIEKTAPQGTRKWMLKSDAPNTSSNGPGPETSHNTEYHDHDSSSSSEFDIGASNTEQDSPEYYVIM